MSLEGRLQPVMRYGGPEGPIDHCARLDSRNPTGTILRTLREYLAFDSR